MPSSMSKSGSGSVKKAILVVDSYRMEKSRECVEAVAGWLPGSGFERVEVWHWEVLKVIEERERGEGETRDRREFGDGDGDGEAEEMRGEAELEQRRRVEECYFGAIKLVEESRREVEGDVKTTWSDGISSHYRVKKDGEVEVLGNSGF